MAISNKLEWKKKIELKKKEYSNFKFQFTKEPCWLFI